LVELLVAMTVTLILIFALAQAFAVVGDSVSKGRAAIEMSSNLRMVAHRLQQDLQGMTVPVRPGADEGSGGGYVEIVDGASVDKDWNADGTNDINPTNSDTTYGDVDDVIAFTTRNAKSPFFGTAYQRGNGLAAPLMGVDTLDSTLAEVVWWIQYQDLNDNGIRGSGEPFLIYRRAMMIRPDLIDLPIRQLAGATNYTTNPSPGVFRVFTFADGVVITRYSNGTINAVYPNDAPHHLILRDDLFRFYNENDVSVRLIWSVNASGVNVRFACNSLADLTKRENRYAHKTILSDRPASVALAFPPVAAQGNYPALPGPVFPFRLDTNRRSATSLYRNTKHGNNEGEDVMVSNALAFDVQVFDPGAPLLNWNTGEALVPSDPAYFQTIWNPMPTSPPTNQNTYPYTIGYGTFVDLGYGSRRNFHIRAAGWSQFSGMPKSKSKLYYGSVPIYDYCTWSTHYERNGVDEDGDNQTDEGTNGFDDLVTVGASQIYRYGVDDAEERETSPPYPVPLRGIQIRIRTWDPDSRQIRQATVVSDFVPE